MSSGGLESRPPHFRRQSRPFAKIHNPVCKRLRRPDRHNETLASVFDQVRSSCVRGRNDWNTTRHGFVKYQTEAILNGRKDEDRCLRIEFTQLRLASRPACISELALKTPQKRLGFRMDCTGEHKINAGFLQSAGCFQQVLNALPQSYLPQKQNTENAIPLRLWVESVQIDAGGYPGHFF